MEAVDYYVEKARAGSLEEAFHGLRELSPDAIPAMQSVYVDEDDPIVRSLLLKAIWQHRQHSAIDFLADALRDPAPVVWRQALDGLVALASPASIQSLRSAGGREADAERRAWIEEAVDQAAETVVHQAPS